MRHYRQSSQLLLILVALTGLLTSACGELNPASGENTTVSISATAVTPTLTTLPATPSSVITPVPTRQFSPNTPVTVLPTQSPVPTAGAKSFFLEKFSDTAKTGELWFYQGDGTPPRKVVGDLFEETEYAVASPTTVVYFAKGDQTIQLKMVQIKDGQPQTFILDDQVLVELKQKLDDSKSITYSLYGADPRAIRWLAISPDGTQVAYSRSNRVGTTFKGLFGPEFPTEIWVAKLDPVSPAPRKLVANERDYAVRPLWSIDGNRITFIRSTFLGTGAGYETALWSVYKDGSRLSFLTGPELGTYNSTRYSALPAYNLRWIGPMTLAFQATSQTATTNLWVHDLTASSDFSRPVVFEASWERAFFCENARRFVYVRLASGQGNNPLGIYSAAADRTEPALQLDPAGTQLFGCNGDKVLYRAAGGQLYLQGTSITGNTTGPRVSVGNRDIETAGFSPDGAYIAGVTGGNNATPVVFRPDGTKVTIKGSIPAVKPDILSRVKWLDNRLVTFGPENPYATNALVVTVDLTEKEPELRVVGSGCICDQRSLP